jgi:hypothetical protein
VRDALRLIRKGWRRQCVLCRFSQLPQLPPATPVKAEVRSGSHELVGIVITSCSGSADVRIMICMGHAPLLAFHLVTRSPSGAPVLPHSPRSTRVLKTHYTTSLPIFLALIPVQLVFRARVSQLPTFKYLQIPDSSTQVSPSSSPFFSHIPFFLHLHPSILDLSTPTLSLDISLDINLISFS